MLKSRSECNICVSVVGLSSHSFIVLNYIFCNIFSYYLKTNELIFCFKMPFYGSIVVIKRSGADGSTFPLINEVMQIYIYMVTDKFTDILF